MNQIDLKDRTQAFALRIIKLVHHLPKSIIGKTIGSQLSRSGTSVGANYRSACRGRSKAEFIAKLGIAIEECDESAYWLELVVKAELLSEKQVSQLLNECNELTAILNASHKTASHALKLSRQSPKSADHSK
ncbi:MAG: four helix bundle protein [Verrucomicrobium sp.]|nr:four helix bundle protein [Verrucomicrobium sp.]